MIQNSNYFRIHQLADGVFAAISIPGKGSWANAGIIDVGGYTMIFDPFATPSAANNLRNTAEQLTGRKTSFVLNSHHHIDHVHGNQVFHEAAIISTRLTRDQIAVRQPRFVEIVKNHPEHLDHMRLEIEQEKNPLKRLELEELLGEYTAIDHDIDKSLLTLPTITFEDRIQINGSKRTADFITFGAGHSASDAFLFLPEDQILFLADLMHIGYHADFRQGDIDNWINTLEQLKNFDVKMVISGHGAIGSKEDITIMQNYLLDLKKLAYNWSVNGGTADTINHIEIPRQYEHYQVPSIFYGNMRCLLQK